MSLYNANCHFVTHLGVPEIYAAVSPTQEHRNTSVRMGLFYCFQLLFSREFYSLPKLFFPKQKLILSHVQGAEGNASGGHPADCR